MTFECPICRQTVVLHVEAKTRPLRLVGDPKVTVELTGSYDHECEAING